MLTQKHSLLQFSVLNRGCKAINPLELDSHACLGEQSYHPQCPSSYSARGDTGFTSDSNRRWIWIWIWYWLRRHWLRYWLRWYRFRWLWLWYWLWWHWWHWYRDWLRHWLRYWLRHWLWLRFGIGIGIKFRVWIWKRQCNESERHCNYYKSTMWPR